MKRNKLSKLTSIFAATMLAFTPLTAWATEADGEMAPATTPLAPVIITEVQPGVTGGSADNEFIELYNTTDENIDISGWEVWYNPKVEVVSNPPAMPAAYKSIIIGNGEPEPAIISAGGYYLLTSKAFNLPIPDGVDNQEYDFTMTYDASLRLFSLDKATCELSEIDRVGWGTTIVSQGMPVKTTSSKRGAVRVSNDAGYADSGVNVDDFEAVSTAYNPDTANPTVMTPGEDNLISKVTIPTEYEPSVYNTLANTPVGATDCGGDGPDDTPSDPPESEDSPAPTVPDPESWPPAEVVKNEDPENAAPQPSIPAANVGLKAPVLSELLPNPASPLTDANDEFIELYNPNDAYFDLSGYVLEVGLKTKRRHTIPAGTKIAPRTFLAFFSAQTKLALSNSGGQVALVDPLGRTLAVSEAYGTAKDGQAWVFANGIWQWTTKPTPNASNVVSAPVVKSASTKKTASTSSSSSKTGSSGTSNKADSEEDTVQTAAFAAAPSTPLHPSALAVVAVFALLYGAYEYRRDMANRIYQFRANRAARRALRQSAEGE